MIISPARLEPCLAGIEQTFNVLECFPVLANFSGGTRCMLGKLQIITGIAVCVLAVVAYQFITPSQHQYCHLAIQHAFEHVLHGVANIIRGTAATVFFMGPLLFFTYDLINCRFCYSSEKVKPLLPFQKMP